MVLQYSLTLVLVITICTILDVGGFSSGTNDSPLLLKSCCKAKRELQRDGNVFGNERPFWTQIDAPRSQFHQRKVTLSGILSEEVDSKDERQKRSIFLHKEFASPKRRRSIGVDLISSSLSIISASLVGRIVTSPEIAEATFTTSEALDGAVSAKDLASKLRAVPTFSLVDSEGVPYFVFGEDAKVTSYFFVSFDEAQRILQKAKESSDKAIAETFQEMRANKLKQTKKAKLTKDEEKSIMGEVGINPWLDARITSVPLDTAVTLATKASSSKRSGGIHFQVAASSSDIEEALRLDGSDDLTEGNVPLFYFESFERIPITSLKMSSDMASSTDDTVTPIYFSKQQLIDEFRSLNPGVQLPDIKTTELFATLTEMVRPVMVRNGKPPSKKELEEKEDLRRLVFVPPSNSSLKAAECQKSSPSYKIGQSNIVL